MKASGRMRCFDNGGWQVFHRLVCVLVLAGLSACATTPAERSEPPGGPAREEQTTPARRSPLVEPPGVYFAEVTEETIQTTICVPGWTATVRPSTSFTTGVKLLMLKRAGLGPADATNYELDHFVPLALGGHPRSEDNLWLQPWIGRWSAKVKDQLERKLQVMVCAGELALDEARGAIRKGWKTAYRRYVRIAAKANRMEIQEEEAVE